MKTQELKNNVTAIAKQLIQTNYEWMSDNNNPEFATTINLYENGYRVAMYHGAAAPQYQSVTTVKFNTNQPLGNVINGHNFTGIINENDIDYLESIINNLIEE